MPFDFPTPRHSRKVFLAQRASLALNDAEGTTIAVDHGCLWLTMERDPRDIILTAGMRFEIDRGGRTVIAAEEDTRFRVRPAREAASRARAWLAGLAERLSSRRTARGARASRRYAPYY
ncbi:MAG TPA: DUF2917 domain-containing protein [Casimicrobiaceae bacterium]|nr:DUF2917 domain-containing protein [Casimicrobiaceae bacterium]